MPSMVISKIGPRLLILHDFMVLSNIAPGFRSAFCKGAFFNTRIHN